MLVGDYILVKSVDLFSEFFEFSFFQAILLDCFHNWYDKVPYFQNKCFKFDVKWCFPKIIVDISNEMNPTFLLLTVYRVIARVEV